MKDFAVAVTMTKPTVTGTNVRSHLLVISAISEDEARGIAHKRAQEEEPEHSIFLTNITELENNGTKEAAIKLLAQALDEYDRNRRNEGGPYCNSRPEWYTTARKELDELTKEGE